MVDTYCYRFIISCLPHYATSAKNWLKTAHHLGFDNIQAIDYQDLYFVQGSLSQKDLSSLSILLHDKLLQKCQVEVIGLETYPISQSIQFIERVLKPGVSDIIAEQIQLALSELGILGVVRVLSGQRWVMQTNQFLSPLDWQQIMRHLGLTTVIHHTILGTFQSLPLTPKIDTTLNVGILPLCHGSDAALIKLSQERRLALNLEEMRAIQSYYRTQAREPADIELETIAQVWSEHCSHKSFRSLIQYGDQTIDGLLQTYLRAATRAINAPWVASAFVDNAGIIDFDEDWQLAFKVETHNHPSAIEPFGGANTGMGGVIRDVLGVSARPIAATDVFGLGFMEIDLSEVPIGSLHPRVIQEGVISGVGDYGNKVGIPTVNGAVVFDRGYLSNPLVFCGCVGLLPKNSHPTQVFVGDRVVVLGGRTGRDGLRGATFSSQTMDAKAGEIEGAVVQVGNPIIARGLIEVITRARDQRLYHAITDCGAGGLSSAVGEMAQHSGCGVVVDLARVPLKYPGLQPWEIWLSEAQERMVLSVLPESVPALQKLCDTYEVELADLGTFTDSTQLQVYFGNKRVLQLERDFLYGSAEQGGMPWKKLQAMPRAVQYSPEPLSTEQPLSRIDYEAMLLKLLKHPQIESRANIIQRYDHEIQGGTVIRPLVGMEGPSDACVIKPQGILGLRGFVLSNGINPELGKLDPYNMAVSVIDEAIRNAVAVGANPDRIAILDNFCWGNIERPETLSALVVCARGCFDAALHYQTPFISGKDSLNNEYQGPHHTQEAIPGTLLISALGIIEDITKTVSMDFKRAGHQIYLLGETKTHFGGSHFIRCGGIVADATVPDLPLMAPRYYRCLHEAIRQGWISSCHDLSEGGLGVALSEMCIGGQLGCTIVLDRPASGVLSENTIALFSESNGRLLIEVAPYHNQEVIDLFARQGLGELLQLVGQVEAEPILHIQNRTQALVLLPVSQLTEAFTRACPSSV